MLLVASLGWVQWEKPAGGEHGGCLISGGNAGSYDEVWGLDEMVTILTTARHFPPCILTHMMHLLAPRTDWITSSSQKPSDPAGMCWFV